MHLQFVEHVLCFFGRQSLGVFGRLGRLVPGNLFGLPAQFGGVIWSAIYSAQCAPPPFDSFARSVVEIAYVCPASFTRAVEVIQTSRTVPLLVTRCVRYGFRILARLT